MDEQAMDEQAIKYATAYINGNRTSTCRDILERNAGPAPYARVSAAVMASKVVVRIMREDHDSDMAEEFIRLLAAAAATIN